MRPDNIVFVWKWRVSESHKWFSIPDTPGRSECFCCYDLDEHPPKHTACLRMACNAPLNWHTPILFEDLYSNFNQQPSPLLQTLQDTMEDYLPSGCLPFIIFKNWKSSLVICQLRWHLPSSLARYAHPKSGFCVFRSFVTVGAFHHSR